MPLQETSGNVTADAYGGGVPAVPNYIEDVFSTYLYTGTGATNNIVNSIDLSGKGGLVWIKSRGDATNHALFDTNRGVLNRLQSNTTNPEASTGGSLTAFNANGFTVDYNGNVNASGITQASWTFRKQPKFFDVVTFTGTGNANQTITHSLGSTPGCVIVKRLSGAGQDWLVWCQTTGGSNGYMLSLNQTTAGSSGYTPTYMGATSTSFKVGAMDFGSASISNGYDYVAYLFAHNAGGFGLTGTDNVISCGSATATAGTWTDVNVGFEPQWVLIKNSTATGSYNPSGSAGSQDWYVIDTMRGATAATGTNTSTVALSANSSIAEYNDVWFGLTSTGFSFKGVVSGSDNFIYIAIRRGPMKVPTDATKVFAPVTQAGGGFDTAGFPVDLLVLQGRNAVSGATWTDRLRGSSKYFNSSSTAAESSTTGIFSFDNQTGVQDNYFGSGTSVAYWNFQRAPSFFDEVCYTGTGTAGQTYTHNLGVAPEFMIVKNRTTASQWLIYQSSLGNTQYLLFTTAASASGSFAWNNTSPTSSVFSVGTSGACNTAGENYVAYLFATCAGVSKVGSYTGNGTTQTINCGFTGGARFVLIKRTDSTGDWYVYDTARGMTVLTDPYLLLNSTAAESATLGSVTTVSTGFAVNASILAAINTNGASYIFLAIA